MKDDKIPGDASVDLQFTGLKRRKSCDVAVDLIAAVSGHAFSFQPDRATNYTAAQIDEVRRTALSV